MNQNLWVKRKTIKLSKPHKNISQLTRPLVPRERTAITLAYVNKQHVIKTAILRQLSTHILMIQLT